MLVLTRDAGRVTIASISRTIRCIRTEVVLDEDDGMPARCAVSLDNLGDAWKAMLTDHVTDLDATRMQAVCLALAVAVGCDR